MKKSKIVVTIISAIIIVVGVFALVYNAVIVYNSDLKYLTYKNIEATISTVQSSYIDGNVYYRATYTFSIDGISYNCPSDFSADENKYVVGDTAAIRYNSKNPTDCYVSENSRTFNYLYLGFSCILLIIGIKLFIKQIG
jgi:cytochrome c oxidase assembly protein Cox11